MNFSVNILLTASAVLMIVFTPQSNADRVDDLVKQGQEASKNGYNRGNNREGETINIIKETTQKNLDDKIFVDATKNMRQAFIDGVRELANSEDNILRNIKAAEKVVLESTEAAKRIMQKAFTDSRISLFKSGTFFLKSSGIVVGLTNNATRPGLESACKLILKAGFAVQDALTGAESLFNQGIEAGGNAVLLLLEAMRQAVEIGYAAAYKNNQISVQEAVQTLRNARNSSRAPDHFETGNCTVAENDSEGSDALKAIDEAANTALKRGAKPELVEQFKQVLKCTLGDFLIIEKRGQQNYEDIKPIVESDPQAAKMRIAKQAEVGKESMYDLTATIYSYLGEAALKSGNQSSPKLDEVITLMELSKVKFFSMIDISGEFIIFGMRYKCDALDIAFKAALKACQYGKSAWIQSIKDIARIVFSYVI